MTFWGVEVKPGKPFTFNSEDLNGKLILTQATLGTGSATKKSTLQVNVGDKSPVFLCTLLPDKSESCSLNLEFEEDDDVKFSVVGPTSIHLSGFVQDIEAHDCDSDSYGEDIISEIESDSSETDSEEHENHFIDDDDFNMFPPSSARNSGVFIEEIVDDEKDASENGGTKQEKKKNKKKKQLADAGNEKEAEQQIVVKSNTGVSELESEDEDGFPVSSSHKSKTKSENFEENMRTRTAEEGEEKKKKVEAKNNGDSAKSLKRKVDDEQKSEATNGDASEKKKKQKKKKAKKEEGDEVATIKQDASAEDKQMSKNDKESKQSKAKHAKVKTYPNGLVVEEIAMGKPNGKRASTGSKVSVYYSGKLQKNNKQFDSNIGRKPFKFHLGIGQVIKGWDVGLEGMRVGDKRKLTIPPAMGYGASGAPPQIPPNAWLVFEVELADVA